MGYYEFLKKSMGQKDDRKQIGFLDLFQEDDFVKYGNGNVPSQNMIIDLPIDEYIGLCEPIPYDDADRHTNLKNKVERGEIEKFATIPLLKVRQMEDGENAKVYGHDGRHRALLMKDYGLTKIPVRLYAENFCWGEVDGRDAFDDPGRKLRGWPKWLWCQNDRSKERSQYRWAFPVAKEDAGKEYDLQGLRMGGCGCGGKCGCGKECKCAAMDERKVFRDAYGRLLGTAESEGGEIVYRDKYGRRVASASFDDVSR